MRTAHDQLRCLSSCKAWHAPVTSAYFQNKPMATTHSMTLDTCTALHSVCAELCTTSWRAAPLLHPCCKAHQVGRDRALLGSVRKLASSGRAATSSGSAAALQALCRLLGR